MGLPLDSAICKRCNQGAIETDEHRYWTCPGNRNIPECRATVDLEAAAVRDGKDPPCYWYRGLMPSDLLSSLDNKCSL